MSTQVGNLATLTTDNAVFNGTKANDIALYSLAGQSVWIGCLSNASSNFINVNSNGIAMQGSLAASMPFALNNPGVEMTAYATSNAAGAYYVASASTESNSSARAWNAFDGLPLTYWQASNAFYSAAGAYIGSNTTFFNVNSNNGIGFVSRGSVSGEWLQIQMPTGILATSATITSSNVATTPAKVTLLSSHDGSTWDFVASNADVNTNTTLTLTAASNAVSGNIFRLVTSSNVGATSPAIVNFNIAGNPKPFTTTDSGAVGIGVDEPVQALEVAGNVVCSGSVSAGNLGMFRNRIINGNFMIDQRGSATTPVTATNAYGPDRFYCGTNPANITGFNFAQYTMTTATDLIPINVGFRNGLRVNTGTRSAGNVADIHQKIELSNCYDIMLGVVTVSFWARSSVAGQITVVLYSSQNGTDGTLIATTQNISLTTSWQRYTLQFSPTLTSPSTGALNTIGMQLTLHAENGMPSGAINYYTGIQLEKGTIATPFEFRPYPVELQLCQRYAYFINMIPGATQRLITASLITNLIYGIVKFPVNMRAYPTLFTNLASSQLCGNGAGILASIGTSVDPMTINANDTSTESTVLRVPISYTGTINLVCYITTNSSTTTNSYLGFTAEL